jgi:anti-sigma factor RsiW
MNQITDEILNKYLDGELNALESEQVKAALHSSEDLQRKFNALKIIHDNLSGLKEDELSSDFTDRLMKKIVKRSTVPKQQKYFIASIVSFITLLCLVIFGFSISAILSASSSTTSNTQSILDSVTGLSEGLVRSLQQLFSGTGLSIIGSIFSLIILISGYFFFEMQKRSKANLSNGQHL